MQARRPTDRFFELLSDTLVRHPFWVIGLFGLMTAVLGSSLATLQFDTSPEAMLHRNDPIRLEYDHFRDVFGRDQMIVVGVPAPEVFDDGFIDRLQVFQSAIEQGVPHVRTVTSLVDARFTRGEDDTLIVGELLKDWKAAGGDMPGLQRMAVGHPLYRDNLIARSGSLVAVVIETDAIVWEGTESADDVLAGFDDDLAHVSATTDEPARRYLSAADNAAVIDAISRIIEEHRAPGFEPLLSGSPVVVDAFDRATMKDMAMCTAASMGMIAIVLVWFFRRPSGVLLPNLVVSGASVMTFGLMAALGAPFTLSTAGVAPVLIAVGICSSIHLLTPLYRSLEEHGDRKRAVTSALVGAGPAIVMTSLTTAAGLFSFALADLYATAQVGRFASAGVLFCLLLTVVLLPAVVALCPLRPDVANPASSDRFDRSLVSAARFATGHHRSILAVGFLVFAAGTAGLTLIRFSHDPITYFGHDTPVRSALETIDRELRGGMTLEVVVDSGEENGLSDPALLRRLDDIGAELASRTEGWLPVTRIFSLNDIVKETHQALYDDAPHEYRIPDTREVLSQELFLFENSGSQDLSRLVDPGHRHARLSIVTPHADGVVYRDFVREVEKVFQTGLQGTANFVTTGGMALEVRAVTAALESMSQSYLVAFVVISFLMVVFLGDIKLGLVSMIPNMLPIVSVIGLMGWIGAPIDMTSITIGSIGLGLVVDDTIHFMHNFQKFHGQTGDVTRATERAFLGAGRAMVVTTVVLLGCFWVDLMASLANVVRFGVFVGLIALVALFADFLVAPALMRWLVGREDRSPVLSRGAKRVAASVALVIGASMFFATPAEAVEARSIMQRVESRDDGERMAMELEMVLMDQSGHVRERRARSLSQDREGGRDSIMFFLAPSDVRETGFLTFDHSDPSRPDDQYLYLPALGRSKRIASSEKSRSFMGSDFSYADLTRRSTDRYRYTLAGEREVAGHDTWQIEAVPLDDDEADETGYDKSIVFVRKDIDVVVRAVHFVRGSDDLKYLDVKQLELVDDIWTATEIHMSTRRAGRTLHKTILRHHNVQYDTEIPSQTFSTRRLERGL